MAKRWTLWGLFAVLSVAALISSLGTAFQTLPLNPDMAEMAMIYNGTVHHGWMFPFTWRFTQDNQVLSLLPFAEIYYALAGVSGSTIIIQGWLIFVVNAALTGMLVKVATKSWRWAWLAWLLALLASPMAVGQPAILAYPVTHNSVWAFGSLGAIGLIRYFTDRPKWALPLVLACVFVGTVSDPWFDAAFTAPVLLLAWKSPKWFQADKTMRHPLTKSVIIIYIMGRITYFGLELLHMAPGRGIGFASPSAMIHHLLLLAKSTGILLQFYPFPSNLLGWVLWSTYIIGLCGVVTLSFQARRENSPAVRILLVFSRLSIGIIAAAYVLTNFAHSLWAARFLVNVFYLAIAALVTFGAVHWFTSSTLTKLLLGVTLIGYVMLGLTTIDRADWRYTPNWAGTHKLSKWLIAHNYKNGYGQYFEANTPLLGVASNEKIIARPLSCNMGYLIPRLASGDDQFWFATAPLPSHRGSQFVAFDENDAKWQNCAIRDFGKPDQKFRHGALNIWVYRHDLSQQLILEQSAFRHKWTLMNIARNRQAIANIGKTLDISSAWAQSAYTWLLKKGIA